MLLNTYIKNLQRTELPENAKLEDIRCIRENDTIVATAPLRKELKSQSRPLLIESKESSQEQQRVK